MNFRKYQHIERFGTEEVEDIEFGQCYIFPKIDGTNASVWLKDDFSIGAGSRNRELSLENDNQGFTKFIYEDKRIKDYLKDHPEHRLFGEWLVPHSLKTYKEDAWKKFYIFDVVIDYQNIEGGIEYLQYEIYKEELEKYNLDYIPCLAKIKNPDYDKLIYSLNQNNFLIEDGKGVGEGIVIKNYGYRNRYGRQTWAKIVTSEFKEKHIKTMGPPEVSNKTMIEEKIVEDFCTSALIDKTFAKIKTENKGWNSKMIPRLLNTVYHELIAEEIWNILKKYKNPTINFKTLQTLVNIKIKDVKKDIF